MIQELEILREYGAVENTGRCSSESSKHLTSVHCLL